MFNRRHFFHRYRTGRELPSAVPKVWAQAKPEKTKISLAVGGKAAFYYLPLTISEQLGYFKAEGLDVEISDFAGGSRALQAVVGGSADVCSGAYEHTINLQAKNQFFQAFVLEGRAPQIALGVSTKNMPSVFRASPISRARRSAFRRRGRPPTWSPTWSCLAREHGCRPTSASSASE